MSRFLHTQEARHKLSQVSLTLGCSEDNLTYIVIEIVAATITILVVFSGYWVGAKFAFVQVTTSHLRQLSVIVGLVLSFPGFFRFVIPREAYLWTVLGVLIAGFATGAIFLNRRAELSARESAHASVLAALLYGAIAILLRGG